MPSCAAMGCKNRVGSPQTGLSFHRFPQDDELRRHWCFAARRRPETLAKTSRLCSEHFTEDCFDPFNDEQQLRWLVPGTKIKRKLKLDAVPTIFNRSVFWNNPAGPSSNTTTRREGASLKRSRVEFPKNDAIQKRWVAFLKSYGYNGKLSANTRLCSDHFTKPDSFQNYNQRLLGLAKFLKLVAGAVPSLPPVPTRDRPPPTTSVAIVGQMSLLEHAIEDPTDQIDTITIKSEVPSDPEDKVNTIYVQCKMEQSLAEMKIGFIGAGNMAFGIAQGMLMSGEVNSENVKVSAPSSNNLGRFRDMGVAVTHSNAEVVNTSRLVFLAVKPHLLPVVLREIADLVTREHVVVSVAAGVTIATVEELLPSNAIVLRLMPNLPCVVQEGALLFTRGSRARPEHGALLRDLLAPCGLVEEGPESWIDAHTGLSGSGVAFVYLFAEALAEGGVKMGMPSALAHRIAAQTILGAGRLLRDSGKHPAQLRSDVCTPGGTTIFGLHELERGGLRAATMGAVEAATERAKELGRK